MARVWSSVTAALNFKMPSDYVGTPQIVLVTPRETVILNQVIAKLGIADDYILSMDSDIPPPMFQKQLWLIL